MTAEYHQLTKHGAMVDRSRLARFQPLDPTNRPAPFKRYPGRRVEPIRHDWLARLLFLTAGVTRTAGEGRFFRAAMSAGNLHPVEIYVVGDGVAHFAPREVGLTPLRSECVDVAAEVALVLTGIPWRTAWKYGERGYRHLWWDAGTMLANLLTVADADGVAVEVDLGFDDAAVSRLVGVDGTTEFPLALVRIRPSGRECPPPDLDPITPEVEPLSLRPITFPLIEEAHRAGELRTSDAVTRWRAAAANVGRPATVTSASPVAEDVEDLILRRGSTRIMRREAVAASALTQVLAAAVHAVPGDFCATGGTLLEHFVAVHAVEGTAAGAYRWSAEGAELLWTGDLRQQSTRICYGQPLGGDSAYTAFHCTDLDSVLAVLGPRGYRAAQLEAGVAAGRLQLAAFASGLGATGLTFLDDEVSALFQTDAACMLVTSVGVPAYRSKRGGPAGRPTELTRFDDLMVRLSSSLGR